MYAMYIEMHNEFVTSEVVSAVSVNKADKAPSFNVDAVQLLKRFKVDLGGLEIERAAAQRYILGEMTTSEVSNFERLLEQNVSSEREIAALYRKLDYITDVVGKNLKAAHSSRVNKYTLVI